MRASVFEVFVPKERWPTFSKLNAALETRAYPVRVLPQEGQNPDSPLAPIDWELATLLTVRNEERRIILEEASSNVIEAIDAEDINERLEESGSSYRVSPGMTNFVTSFNVNGPSDFTAAAVLLNAVMILDFDGYGFDGEEMKFGRQDYAERMLAWIQTDLNPAGISGAQQNEHGSELPTAEAKGTTAAPLKSRKGFPLWRTLAVIFLLLLLAEFVDKNIYNFTGTDG